mmetsp:Transcript_35940/g.71552  ORF Transcript_35940/g.71552 Transcript_35940/m.71552 type:complete len:162 (-) Transcript_35940:53-538(-)
MVNHVRNVFMETDADNNGQVTWKEFELALEHQEMKEVFRAVDMDPSEAKNLFKLLDVHHSGSISVNDFISGCNRLRGPAKSLDLMLMAREVHRMSDAYVRNVRLIERALHTCWGITGRAEDHAQDAKSVARKVVSEIENHPQITGAPDGLHCKLHHAGEEV